MENENRTGPEADAKAPLSEGEGKGLHFPGKISYIRRKAEQHEEVN